MSPTDGPDDERHGGAFLSPPSTPSSSSATERGPGSAEHGAPTPERTPTVTNIWHRAYCRWYDHDNDGHRLRARLWGWFADRIVRWA